MNLRKIDEGLVREAKVRALERGTSLKQLVEEALKRFLGDAAPAPGGRKNDASAGSKRRKAGRRRMQVPETAS